MSERVVGRGAAGLLLAGSLLAAGCSFGVQGAAGPSMSTSLRDGHQGGAFGLRAFAGVATVGAAVALRGKAAETFGQGTLALEVYVGAGGEEVVPYAFLGIPLLSLESVDGDFVVGALGPYLEVGVAIGLSDGEGAPFLTVAATVEYAARFEDPHAPGEGYLTFQLGVGWGAGGSIAPVVGGLREITRPILP